MRTHEALAAGTGRADRRSPAATARQALRTPARVRDVVRMQESAGNAAVARMLTVQPVAVQRTEESQRLLAALAVPKVGEGPVIEVQTALVDALEECLRAKYTAGDPPSELNLGGIVVDRLPEATRSYRAGATEPTERKAEVSEIHHRLTLAEGESGAAVRFVPLAGAALTSGRSTGAMFGDEVKKAGLGQAVIENALKTMIDAEQLEYLRLAGLPNDEWKILVELHYIRARPKDMAGFHKDTKGQSLFVNLNYHVPGQQLRGPEYVLNPPASAEHDELIFGGGGRRGTLPAEFGEDLRHTRGVLGSPQAIESAGTVGGTGYVAFVDEAIHHATPWFGHRYVTPEEVLGHLERRYPAELKEVTRAKKAHDDSFWPSFVSPVKSYVNADIVDPDNVEKWVRWLELATVSQDERSKRNRTIRYTRDDFAATMTGGEFDAMLDDVGAQPGAARQSAGAGGWHSALIANPRGPTSIRSPVKADGGPRLTRRASRADLTKDWPAQLPDDVPRRFIRSWVRAVPADFARTLES